MALWGNSKKSEATVSNTTPPQSAQAISGVLPTHPPVGTFGIDHTIQLMRTLPTDKNPDLVVSVMKATLESVNVRVTDIVRDAGQRLADIEGHVASLKSEIAAFEREIDVRLKEIVRLEAAHAETTKVKDYLESDVPVVEAAAEGDA